MAEKEGALHSPEEGSGSTSSLIISKATKSLGGEEGRGRHLNSILSSVLLGNPLIITAKD